MLRELNRFTQRHGNVAFLALLVLLVGPLIFIFGSGGCDQHSGSLTGDDAYGMLGEMVVTSADYKHHAQAEAIQYYLKTGKVVNLNAITRRPNWVNDYKEPVLLRMRILLFAKENGFDGVTDTELGKYKASQKAFQNEKGQFVPSKYENFTTEFFESQPITISDFDQMCRENIIIDRFESMLDKETTNAAALRANILANGGEPEYTFKEFNRRNYTNKPVPDEEVKKVYETEKSSTYLVPEKLRAKLAAFKVAELPEGVDPITDEAVKAHYDDNPKDYMSPAQVKASHILISYKGAQRSTVERSEADAEKRAEEVLKKVKAKDADFAKLAKEFSDGPSSSKGGDLGFFPRKGVMDEAFSKAAFELKKGGISGLVKSPFGFHIIKKTDDKKEELRPFDSVKETIRRNLVNDAIDAFYGKQAQDIYKADKAAKYSKKQATIAYIGITKSNSTDEKDIKLDKDTAESIRKKAADAKDLIAFAKETKEKNPDMKITHSENKNIDISRKDLAEYIKQGIALKVGETSTIIDEPDAYYIVRKVSERDNQPFSEVRSQILSKLKSDGRAKALKDAEDAAQAFLAELNKKPATGKAAVEQFETIAKTTPATLADTPLLGKDDKNYLPTLFGGVYAKTIYNGISKLTEEKPYSDVFKDYKHVYVGCFLELKPAHEPKLEEVKAKIYGDIMQRKSIEAAQEAADKLHKELSEKLAKGLVPDELKEFTKPREYPNPQYTPEPDKTAKQLSMRTKVGEVSVQNLPDRGAVIVYVSGRELQDEAEVMETFDRMSKNMVMSGNQMKFFRQYSGEQGVMLIADYPFVKSLEQLYAFQVRPELESIFADNEESKN